MNLIDIWAGVSERYKNRQAKNETLQMQNKFNILAGVAQLVRAPDCDSGGRRFEPGHSPH